MTTDAKPTTDAAGNALQSAIEHMKKGNDLFLVLRGTPDWRPLEALIPPAGLAPMNAPCTLLERGDFLWMGVATQMVAGTLRGIRLYKHTRTRRYLNIDHEGRFYRYEALLTGTAPGKYVEIERDEALRWVVA